MGLAGPSLQVQPQSLRPAPNSPPTWTGLPPQASWPPLTAPCCTPLSDYSWPGQSQALIGMSRSEERTTEKKGGGGGRREGVSSIRGE